ncbi:hypothetical protein KAK06_21300 [Ideonella sp. 4Y11]|uniref:Uncharacterized protein n=1 Tax=Ideonella aquatica TaxID=2824119 RepID=A0A941BM01_9BURK|nr:hypothetical protein [Ideonella aquatica]MBQ0961498.1 hypothetical protein [Ideonella aquatica]
MSTLTASRHAQTGAVRLAWLLLALMLLAVVGIFAAAWVTMLEGPQSLIQVVVNGEELHFKPTGPLPPAHQVVLAGIGGLLALGTVAVVLVALPLALLAAAAVLVVVLLAGVGLPLAAVAVAVALLLSPLWLLGWALWRALRPARSIPA